MTNKNEAVANPLSRREVLGAGLRLGGSALAVTISARALGLSPAVAKVPEEIVIGQVPFNTEVTIYAEAIGQFKEEGLSVEYHKAVGGPAVVQALAAGSIPAGDIGVGPALTAAARKISLVSPALGGIGTPTHPFSRIMTLPDSQIRSVTDLKGKKIALHQRGVMEDLVLPALKMTYGIGPQDVEIVLIPSPNQPQVLSQGLVDAIFASPPTDAVAEQKFNARTVIDVADFVPYLGYGTFSFRQDFVEAYPDAAVRLMKAWIRTCRWIDDNAVQANAIAGAGLGIAEEVRPHLRQPYFARNGLAVLPNVWHIYYMLVAGKVLDPVDDPGRLIGQSVVEPAKRIGQPALEAVGQQSDPEALAMLRAPYPLLPNPVETYYSDWERALLRT
jgi:ABC-type nitrate/sulfonate/bicarbonate transport system substrate-binding protein